MILPNNATEQPMFLNCSHKLADIKHKITPT